jgi:glucosamine 6-phosphate synthetase-like amidotransferase/phosphosugar isomerase protein
MCGIVYAKSFRGKNINEIVLGQFQRQRSRGTTSFGFYLPMVDQLTHNIKESRIKTLLRRRSNSEVLFHHRYSTSTIDCRSACHPFSTKDHFAHNYIGVHNGIISNAYALKSDHEKLGINYVSVQENGSFNDSESLIYDVARFIEGQTDKINAQGSIAFIIIQRGDNGKPSKLYFGRNGTFKHNLFMDFTKKHLIISSEGRGNLVEENQLYEFDYQTGKITKTPVDFPETVYYSKKWEDNYSQPTWDEDWDYQYTKKSYHKTKAKNTLLLESTPIDKTKKTLKDEFLKNNYGKAASAALAAEMEYEELKNQESGLEFEISNEDDVPKQDLLIERWAAVSEYGLLLKTIADELYAEAKRKADKTDLEVLDLRMA